MNRKSEKPLHLLIDGVDKIGKSTVIQSLSRILNLPIIKMPRMKEYIEKNQTEEFSQLFNETIIQFQEFSFILDRGFPSSLAYSLAYDRKYDLSYIDRIQGSLKPQIFILDGIPRLKDEIYTEEQLNKVRNVYLDLCADFDWTLLSVDGKSPIQICQEIITSLEEEFPDLFGTSTVQTTK